MCGHICTQAGRHFNPAPSTEATADIADCDIKIICFITRCISYCRGDISPDLNDWLLIYETAYKPGKTSVQQRRTENRVINSNRTAIVSLTAWTKRLTLVLQNRLKGILKTTGGPHLRPKPRKKRVSCHHEKRCAQCHVIANPRMGQWWSLLPRSKL